MNLLPLWHILAYLHIRPKRSVVFRQRIARVRCFALSFFLARQLVNNIFFILFYTLYILNKNQNNNNTC